MTACCQPIIDVILEGLAGETNIFRLWGFACHSTGLDSSERRDGWGWSDKRVLVVLRSAICLGMGLRGGLGFSVWGKDIRRRRPM